VRRRLVRQNFPEFGAQWTMEDAEGHAVEQCEEAPESQAGLRPAGNFTLERAGRSAGPLRCAERRATKILDELSRRFPAATLTTRLHRP
jgi:hypothetical protein